MLEYNHKICFSIEPLKECPEGTSPVENQQQQSNDYISSEEQQQPGQQQQQQQKRGKKMSFVCLPRSSSEARRLQRQARRGVIVSQDNNINGHSPNFIQQVKEPSKCVRY